MSSKQPIPGRCGAKLRRKDTYCAKAPCEGSKRCELHGGKTPVGPASPHWKTGKHSKYALPPKLLDRYIKAEADPDLLSLRSESALLETRIQEIAARFETGETSGVWESLDENWNNMVAANRRLREAREAGDGEASALAQADATAALESIGRLIKTGTREQANWNELRDAIGDKQKVVTAENKRLIDMSQTLSADQALAFAATLLSLVKQNVQDRRALSNISEGMNRLLKGGSLSGAVLGGETESIPDAEVVEAVPAIPGGGDGGDSDGASPGVPAGPQPAGGDNSAV